jgi:hypothetical protein
VLERLLALRLIEEAREIRERRLLTRDRRMALRVEMFTRVLSAAAVVAAVAASVRH